MKPTDFKKLVRARQRHTDATLIAKGAEYARNNDRLHNFKKAAAMNDETPAQSLWGMLTKHIVSAHDMVKDTEKGIIPSDAQINEKLGDIINYMHLLEGVFIDMREEQL